MATSIGRITGSVPYPPTTSTRGMPSKRLFVVQCAAAAGSLTDHYQALRIQPGASEKDVKKAFRQLALQYHPDVCKGRDCGVQFHRINEAYDIVIGNLRAAAVDEGQEQGQSPEWAGSDNADDEPMMGMYDSSWDMWEEWMGWEGAGTRVDYSSHINPYL